MCHYVSLCVLCLADWLILIYSCSILQPWILGSTRDSATWSSKHLPSGRRKDHTGIVLHQPCQACSSSCKHRPNPRHSQDFVRCANHHLTFQGPKPWLPQSQPPFLHSFLLLLETSHLSNSVSARPLCPWKLLRACPSPPPWDDLLWLHHQEIQLPLARTEKVQHHLWTARPNWSLSYRVPALNQLNAWLQSQLPSLQSSGKTFAPTIVAISAHIVWREPLAMLGETELWTKLCRKPLGDKFLSIFHQKEINKLTLPLDSTSKVHKGLSFKLYLVLRWLKHPVKHVGFGWFRDLIISHLWLEAIRGCALLHQIIAHLANAAEPNRTDELRQATNGLINEETWRHIQNH